MALLLHGEGGSPATYADVFRADWRGGVWTLPVDVVVAVVLGVVGAAVVARRVSFEPGHATPGGPDQ